MDGSGTTSLVVLGALFVVLGVFAVLDVRRARLLRAQGRPTPATLKIAFIALAVAVIAGASVVWSALH